MRTPWTALNEGAGVARQLELSGFALWNHDGELGLYLGDVAQGHRLGVAGVSADDQAVCMANDAIVTIALQHAALEISRQRPLTWLRNLGENQFLPGMEQGKLLRRKSEVDLDGGPAHIRVLFEQSL